MKRWERDCIQRSDILNTPREINLSLIHATVAVSYKFTTRTDGTYIFARVVSGGQGKPVLN